MMPPLTGLSRESTEHVVSLWVKEEEEEDSQNGVPFVHPVRRSESPASPSAVGAASL